jgi:hypothetical protein
MVETANDQTAVKIPMQSKTCVFCGAENFVKRPGICSSCAEKLMSELLKTREWNKASKIISDAIKNH